MVERLDRVLTSTEWWEAYPNSQVLVEPVVGSDHSPLVVNMKWEDARGKNSLKFESIWVTSEGCEELVERVWRRKRQKPWLK